MAIMALSLYSLSEDLQAYLDSVDMTEPGSPERAECEEGIARYMERLPDKIDAVAGMLAHLENLAHLAEAESKRLQARKKHFESAAARLEEYCIRVLKQLPEPKRGPRKLEGATATLALRPSEGVIINDETSVPAEYKSACVEMPLPDWNRIRAICPDAPAGACSVRLADVKKALKAGVEVPGADIEYRSSLRRS